MKQCGLYFIDRPKWAVASQCLWVGHYLTFDPDDTASLSPVPNEQNTFAGVLLLNHNTCAGIQNCRSGISLTDTSRNLTFANRFLLSSCGRLISADFVSRFSDGELHLYFQIANTPMWTLFRQMPGSSVPEFKRDAASPTRGWFSSRLEVRILAANAYDVTTDLFKRIPDRELQRRFRIIDGHEAWGAAHHYFGVYGGGMPKSWSTMPAISYGIAVDFEWDNGTRPTWDFRYSPSVQPGATRACYAGAKWNAVDLIESPSASAAIPQGGFLHSAEMPIVRRHLESPERPSDRRVG